MNLTNIFSSAIIILNWGNNMKFLGCNLVKIDSKGRIVIPVIFRNELGENKIILSKVNIIDKPVIAVFPTYKSARKGLKKYLNWSDDNYDRNLSIVTREYTMDSAYRIAISKLIEDREEKEMVAVGRYKNFELWFKSDFEEYCELENLQFHL